MLSEKDLIYFGAILIWLSPTIYGDKEDAVITAKIFYDKIFKKDE